MVALPPICSFLLYKRQKETGFHFINLHGLLTFLQRVTVEGKDEGQSRYVVIGKRLIGGGIRLLYSLTDCVLVKEIRERVRSEIGGRVCLELEDKEEATTVIN